MAPVTHLSTQGTSLKKKKKEKKERKKPLA
jgi:hypothetical protein